jgi:hypothetical protein
MRRASVRTLALSWGHSKVHVEGIPDMLCSGWPAFSRVGFG